MSSSAAPGRYVPPHLRNREPTAPVAGPSRITPAPAPGVAPHPHEKREWSSAPASRQSRTPWASTREDPSILRPTASQDESEFAGAWKPHAKSAPSPSSRFNHARNGSSSISPTLHVFGDSFTGPLKLLSDENAKVTTFKGSSAKGLNNPKSIKQVSRDLLPALNGLLAPPPYAYTPSTGRWALLIFGNVDLQINYLWQLQNKPLSHLSFPKSTKPNFEDGLPEDDATPTTAASDSDSSNVLATATETTLTGPALGPELFVETVVHAYTSWLEREVVNGPIGERIRSRTNSSTASVRKPPPGKVLVAAALPPLVEDQTLPRIPEKYVERLEEDHAKAHRAMQQNSIGNPERVSRTPWANKDKAKDDEVEVEEGLSTLTMTDERGPASPTSSISSNGLSSLDTTSSPDTNITAPSPLPPMSSTTSTFTSISTTAPKPAGSTKITMETLLAHEPPLCTLPIRVQMTNQYNALLSAFCAKYPDILAFVDITPAILAGNVLSEGVLPGSADRNTWACPVDPSNIHPLWEPTLPLWLEELKKEGVPTENYKISADAEDTFKAYEIDKRRRFANGHGGGGGGGGAGGAEEAQRIKLRDE